MELGCGSFVEMEWPYLSLFSFSAESAYFFLLRPVILPQPGSGRIAEQVQVLVE